MTIQKHVKWAHTLRLEKGGHRIFLEDREDATPPRWAIADNSGPTPERTDDGILWLDFSRALNVELGICTVSIPVTADASGSAYWCVVGIDALMTLREQFPTWKVELEENAEKFIRACEGLLTPPKAPVLPAARVPYTIQYKRDGLWTSYPATPEYWQTLSDALDELRSFEKLGPAWHGEYRILAGVKIVHTETLGGEHGEDEVA